MRRRRIRILIGGPLQRQRVPFPFSGQDQVRETGPFSTSCQVDFPSIPSVFFGACFSFPICFGARVAQLANEPRWDVLGIIWSLLIPEDYISAGTP